MMFKNIALILTVFVLTACGGGDGGTEPGPTEPLDTTPPVITLNGESFLEINEQQTYQEPGATATDDKDGEVQVTIQGAVDTFSPNTYELTYSATDRAGNNATTTRTVKVIDITPPNIFLIGNEEQWVEIGRDFYDEGVEIHDNVDIDLVAEVHHTIDVNVPGTYIVTYTARDSAGNESSVTRTVVYYDNIAPIITLNGEAFISLNQGEEFIDPGAVAFDNIDGELEVTVINHVDTDYAGIYVLEYSAQDAYGNQAYAMREVQVIDTKPPVITIQGAAIINLEYGEQYIEHGATAIDNGYEQTSVLISNQVNSEQLGTYIVTYTSVDFYGNEATATRTVNVVDTTAPIISLANNDSIVTYPNFSLPETGATATDSYDGEVDIELSHDADLSSPGEYQITLRATDTSGNTSVETIPLFVSSQRPFILTYETDRYSDWNLAPNEILIQAKYGSNGIAIDWGDGSTEFSKQWETIHTYASAGNYTIKIYGDLHSFRSNGFYTGAEKITAVEQWGDIQWQSMAYMFSGAGQLIINATDVPNLSSVSSLKEMFRNTNLTADLSQWNVSSITNMDSMFAQAGEFNSDISKWDVSNVTNMAWMFSASHAFNADISGWDVSSVTDMSHMFQVAASFNQDLSRWDVSSVTNMKSMFMHADKFNSDLNDWNTSNVTDMAFMFYDAAAFDGLISDWDVSNVTTMESMFYSADSFNTTLATWNVSKVKNMKDMFSNAAIFNSDLSSWNVSSVENMSGMFNGATAFTSDLSRWNTASLLYMARLFENAENFNSDLNGWDVSKVTDLQYVFSGASNFNGALDQWDVSNVTNMMGLFNRASSFNQDINSWDVSNVTTMQSMFVFTPSYSGDMSSWNTSKVTNMANMFYVAKGGYSGYQYWDVSSVVNMYGMFSRVDYVAEDIGGWDVSNVVDMSYMFHATPSLNIDLKNWDVSSVTNMAAMFASATHFTSDLSQWDVSNVTNMNSMFYGNTAFNSDLSNWNTTSLQKFDNTFTGTTSFNGQIQNWNISNVTNGYISSLNLSTEEYDALLISWAKQDVKSGFVLYQYSTQYSSAAESARGLLISKGWQITDAGLKPERTAEQMIAPEISLNGPEQVFIGVGTAYNELSAIATDNLDSELTISISGVVDVNVAGTYELTYTVTDSDGNSTEVVRSVVVTTQRPFITTWDTTLGLDSTDTTIYLITDSTSGAFYIDWGDGSADYVTSTLAEHSYKDPGTYTVKVYGDFARYLNTSSNSSKLKLASINQWGDIQWSSMNMAFQGAQNVQLLATDSPDLSNTTSLANMFASALTLNADLSHWDVSNVTDMSGMFSNAQAFNGDIVSWDVSKVTNMSTMFEQAFEFNQPIGNWDVSQVNDMARMFVSAQAFNQSLNDWNTSNVTSMDSMFSGASSFNGDISSWKVGLVTTMRFMFYNAIAFSADLSPWNVANVSDMAGMFFNNINFTSDISAWDVSKVKTFENFLSFANISASAYSEMLKNWSQLSLTQNVLLNAGEVQYEESAQSARDALIALGWVIYDGGVVATSEPDPITPPTSTDSEAPVVTLIGPNEVYHYIGSAYADKGATAVDNEDSHPTISVTDNVDTSVPGTYQVTYSATDSAGNVGTATRTVQVTAQKPFITSWKTNNVGVTNDNQISINTGLPSNNYYIDWGDGNAEIIETQVTSHTYETIGTYTVTIFGDFEAIYNDPSTTDSLKLESVDQWGDIAWTTMKSAFYGADNIDFVASDTPDLTLVTDMSDMFRDIENLSVDLTQWDVSGITNMSGMFRASKNIDVDLSSWVVGSVTNMSYMFYDADGFTNDLSSWNVTAVTDLSYMFAELDYLMVDPSQWNIESAENISNMFSNTAMLTETYTAILSYWSALDVKANLTLHANLATYYDLFESARTALLAKGWTIVDAGAVSMSGGVGSGGSGSDDVTAPEITLNGDFYIYLYVGDTYNEPGATAIDDVDGEVDVVITGTVDTSTVGRYQITYTATDAAGNSYSTSRYVFVD